jgi:hypothetical protein
MRRLFAVRAEKNPLFFPKPLEKEPAGCKL